MNLKLWQRILLWVLVVVAIVMSDVHDSQRSVTGRAAKVLLQISALALALLAIVGCAGQPIAGSVWGHQIRRFHDDSLSVTCYTVLDEGAMSCMPDWFIAHREAK